jgi:PAS domain S-box-containing protein
MKLQEKTALIFIGLLIVLMVLVSVFSSIVILSSYSSLERQYTEKDLSQAVTRVDDETNTLSAIVSDWGPWDDAYNYVQGLKLDFIDTNLAPDTFNNLRVNVIIITNRTGGIVYSGAYNFSERMMVPVPADLVSQINPGNPLLNMSDPRRDNRGIVMLPDHPMIIVSRPIVRTDFSGEPQGVVIMGRYLDSSEVERLALLTRPTLRFIRVTDPTLPASLVQNLREKKPGTAGIVEPLDQDSIMGYALLEDIYGNDALVLSISDPRSIYQQGLTTTMRFIGIILIAGLVFGLIVMILLDRLVLSRLGALILQVHGIGDKERESARVEIGGKDEFSGLALEINRMLDTIDTISHKVQASETRFRELAGLLPQVIFEMDTEGNIRYANTAGIVQFGITEQMIGQGVNIRRFLSPDNIEQMQRGLTAVMAGALSPGEVYSLQRPDGTFMKAIVSTSLIKKEGKIVGFRGIVVDVTERIRLEEELEDSSKLLTGILQASPVGVFRLDSGGFVTYINETFTRITGIPSESIRGTYWADILPEEERNRVLGGLAQSIREHRTSSAEMRYIHPDGTPYWLFGQTVPIFDKEGKLTNWVGTITDITKQKLIEDELKESEENYRALTENTPDILFSTDMTGIVTYASPQVNKYGFLVEEVVGKPLHIFIHPGDIDQVESNLSRELKEGAQFFSRFRILDKWGTIYWFEEKSTLRLDVSGEPMGIYGILRDVTERKRVEDAIDIANKKLNLMNQITRHDILNTITGLYGCVDMAKATVPPEEKDQLLEEIRELTRVIQRHITFTRQYQEVGVHLPQWQNLTELITSVLQNFVNSGLTFHSEFEKTEIYADPLLEKVFYNLVDNAIRYGETLTTISIYPRISDKGFAIVFEDDGVGVPDAQKREIFKRGVGKNTGMGLFLTAEILAITGITIEENGVYGKGARFVIRIPNGTWRLPRN